MIKLIFLTKHTPLQIQNTRYMLIKNHKIGEIGMETNKISYKVLWSPKNMVGHIDRATYSVDQNRHSICCMYYSKIIKLFYLFINFT